MILQSGPNQVRTRPLRVCECRFKAFKLYLFILLRTLHDVIYMSEFVLFNNAAIFVLLIGKTAKLLLSSMTWVEETKDSLILVTCLRRDKLVLDVYGRIS